MSRLPPVPTNPPQWRSYADSAAAGTGATSMAASAAMLVACRAVRRAPRAPSRCTGCAQDAARACLHEARESAEPPLGLPQPQ